MTARNDVYLKPEHGAFANVHCRRCDEWIGRVQTIPAAEGGPTDVQQAQLEGEIELIAAEHRTLCAGGDDS